MSKGWIKKYRQVMDHPFYTEKRIFSKYEAWDFILMNANHTETKILIKNDMVTIQRGSFITSESKLMGRFQWGKEKLRNFILLLEREGMIEKETARTHTAITVTNYSKYQSKSDQTTDHQEPYSDKGFDDLSDQETDRKQTANRPQTDREPATTKKERTKERKNDDKKEYADYVFLTESEYGKLTKELGEFERDRYFLRFGSWISGETPRVQKSRSAYMTILNWHRDKFSNGKSKVGITGKAAFRREEQTEKVVPLYVRQASGDDGN